MVCGMYRSHEVLREVVIHHVATYVSERKPMGERHVGKHKPHLYVLLADVAFVQFQPNTIEVCFSLTQLKSVLA